MEHSIKGNIVGAGGMDGANKLSLMDRIMKDNGRMMLHKAMGSLSNLMVADMKENL